MEKNKKPLGRYVQRFLPVANTCKAHLEDIEKCMRKTLDEFEPIKSCLPELNENAKPIRYCCIFKTSNNGSLKREDAFRMVGNYFQTKNPANKVDFDTPEYVLILNIICNMCFVSFVKNYFEYKKYNFIEYAAQFSAPADKKHQKSIKKGAPEPIKSEPTKESPKEGESIDSKETPKEKESIESKEPPIKAEPIKSEQFSLLKGCEVSSTE